MKKKGIAYAIVGFSAFSVLASYVICHSSWDNWWLDLAAFFLAPLLLLQIPIIVTSVFFTPKTSWVPALAFVLCLTPWKQFLGGGFAHKANNQKPGFSVMSYNVATFSPNRMVDRRSDSLMSSSFYHWMRNIETPDILCLQEFYHSDLSDFDQSLDSILAIGGYKYFYMNPVYRDEHNGLFAVITFSRFKALQSGAVQFGDHYLNKGTYHDFLIHNDTIRVLNFQLNSMSIRWQAYDSLPLMARIVKNLSDISLKLKRGYEKRDRQLDEIEAFLSESPYKVILCADLNAIPHSHTYRRLRKRLGNAFETAGFGMGFTLNRFPYYVRIDNQFFDPRLNVEHFKTHTDMRASDHFPVEARYSFR